MRVVFAFYLFCVLLTANQFVRGDETGRGLVVIALHKLPVESDVVQRFIQSSVAANLSNIHMVQVQEDHFGDESKFEATKAINKQNNSCSTCVVLIVKADSTILLPTLTPMEKTFVKLGTSVLMGHSRTNSSEESFQGNKFTRFSLPAIGIASHVAELFALPFEQRYANVSVGADFKNGVFVDAQDFHEADLDFIKLEHKFFLFNKATGTNPAVIHASNKFGEMILRDYARDFQLLKSEKTIENSKSQLGPQSIHLLVLVPEPTPFVAEFFAGIGALSFPKKHMRISILSLTDYHNAEVEEFMKTFGKEYAKIVVKRLSSTDSITPTAKEEILGSNNTHTFLLSAAAHLDHPSVLHELLLMNKTAVCPFLEYSSSLKSNVVPFGSYSQQDTEFSRFRGIQIVFCATDAILLRTKVLQKMLANHPEITLFEMGNEYLCKALDNEGIFIFSTSLETFGHMIHSEDFKQGSTEGELYELVKNPFDWRQRYLHPEFELYLNGSKLIKEPCPDVYWFPLMTERYCKSIIREFETFGFWGNGSEEDPRNDGHEPVPTVDVYFTDMGLHETWMQFLRVILFEMVQKVYRGFSRGPPESAHTFLVRYQLGEQTYLRSHEDTAIYTINIAMNPNSDFTGAGLRFSKSECFIPETEMGWGLLHPSRLTHNHEAKPIRSGKRYVQVSFIDNE